MERSEPQQKGALAGIEASIAADLEKLREDVIDLEEWLAAGKTPHPHAKTYIFRVDKEKITVHCPTITGREILEKAGKTPPEKYILRQVLKGGGLEKIELHEIVDLAKPGIEKFRTMPKTAKDGGQ